MIYFVNNENSEILSEPSAPILSPLTVLNRWTALLCQPLKVCGYNGVRLTEIHTTASLVLQLCSFQLETATEELKRRKSPNIDQTPANCRQERSEKLRSVIHRLTPIYSLSKKRAALVINGLYYFA